MFDDILPLVKKPIRYTGGEYNTTIKTNPTINIGIVFPDVYEIGMSNLGIKIIYYLLNKEPEIQCERIFAPWPDFGEKLKANNTPLYGLETKRAINEFDLLGFSLQSELCYTNVFYVLELAKIPFMSSQRNATHPILLAGGPTTLNPVPLSPVFDGFVIGDGEDVVFEIAQILRDIPKKKKDERLSMLAKLDGVWIPQIHQYDKVIKKRVVSQLSENGIPSPAILPICEVTHDRLGIEVMRGCTWGCRFCQSGYANRPLRIRPESDILKAVEKGIRETGWEDVSLLSYSVLDYPDLPNLVRRLNEILRKKNISISLPAMRGELFTEELAILLKEIKKTGITFAPETASEKLRNKLNKPFSNEKLITSINTIYRHGWRQVKLYFMIGLPFERDEDVNEINKLLSEILKAYPKGNINLSVASFVPKPHTPFESVEFLPIEELNEKISKVKRFKKPRIEIKYQSPEVSFIEAFLSRTDKKAFSVIEEVYKRGGYFEEWREGFDFDRWQSAFQKVGINPGDYLKPKERYPWDFVDIGVKKEFLKEELNRALNGIITENCYYKTCFQCGSCDGRMVRYSSSMEKYIAYGRYPRRQAKPILYRVKYSIGEPFRYASHLDITRTIYRALRRTDLPIHFTQGFTPIPKVSFCPPKSVGQIAKGDFFDLYLEVEYFGNISMELNARFPPGIRILEVRSIPLNTPSLSTSINLIYYEANILSNEIKKPVEFSKEMPVYFQTKTGTKNIVEDIESISIKQNLLTCGLYFGSRNINIYELVSYLTDFPMEVAKQYKVTRTAMFIKKEGIVSSPMEVR